jgi:succinate-semialdehyde dehydrogenase / glutarate-semialdehyde dehydrogenase
LRRRQRARRLSGMAIATTNPTSGETVQRFAALEPAEISLRLQRAQDAWRSWRDRPVPERAAVLARAADLLEADKRRYAGLMTLEMGKLLGAAVEEAEKCARGCRHYAEQGERYLAEEVVEDGPGVRERILYQPLGPVLAVMPWNFPFWQVIRFAAPALVAGNVGLLKHAASVPQCALALEDLFRRAGAPEGVFQTLLIGSDAVEAVVADGRVAAVTVTGSEAAGRAVARTAAAHLKKSVLELGGSDPFVVLPSADLERTVSAAVKGRMVNNGQSCIAAKRFIVAAPLYDAFRVRFVEQMRALEVGDPTAPGTELGPLATAAIREGLHQQVRRSVEAGARLLTGGHPIDRPGYFYAPTVLEDAPPDAPAAREELFGPVATLFRARDLDDAIRLANDTPYGLGASVYTRDAQEAERCLREIEAGTVSVNGLVASDPRFPFGGIKHSGYGRELGGFGLREFVNVKRVRVAL